MLDWLGKMLKLPECFIAGTHGHGGGVIQVSAVRNQTLYLFFKFTLLGNTLDCMHLLAG